MAEMSLWNRRIGVLALAVLALLSAAAVAGWLTHGEAMFLAMAQAAWATCF